MFPFLAVRIGIGVISAIFIACKVIDCHNEERKPLERPKEEEDEYDSRIDDDVVVSLYTRNVDLFSSSSSKSNFSGDGTSEEHLRHWALVFEFPNTGRVITYEANETNSYLDWSCKNSVPENQNGAKNHHDIVRCRTSPKELREIAKNINFNYKTYNICYRNCQHWVLTFAKGLGQNVYAAIAKKFKSVSEKEPFMSFLLGTGNAVINATKKLS